jgi:glycosyltransferase involved in cell wall biosynthesis
MNIIWVNHRDPYHPQAGGAEVHLREVAKRLVRKGCNVTLVSERFPGSKREEVIDGFKVLRRGGRLGIHLKAPILVRRLSTDADIVVDDIAHAVPWWSRFVTKTPVVGMVHHVHQSVAAMELGIPLGTVVKLAERTIKPSYNRLITFSQGTKHQIEKQLKVDGSRIHVVYHGVDHEIFRPNGEKFERPTLLSLGRIKKYKNLDHLLRAYGEAKKSVPELRLVICGGGDYKDHIVDLAKCLNLDDVLFVSRVGDEERVRLLQKSWALCSPSFVEGWGLVITEAAACGTPTLAYDGAGSDEAIIDGETGYLVRNGDIRALSDKIVTLNRDDRLRRSMSNTAIAYSNRFNWDSTADETMRILEAAAS